MNIWILLHYVQYSADHMSIKVWRPFDPMMHSLICVIKVQLHVAWSPKTRHKLIQLVIYLAMSFKCINTSTLSCCQTTINGNPYAGERKVWIEVTNVSSKILCILISLTCEQSMKLIWDLWYKYINPSVSTTKCRTFTFKPLYTTIKIVLHFLQDMMGVRKSHIHKVIRIMTIYSCYGLYRILVFEICNLKSKFLKFAWASIKNNI